MRNSQEFEQVDRWVLLHSNHGRNCGQNIDDEEAFDVGLWDIFKCPVARCRDEEADNDLEAPRDIDHPEEP